MTIVAGFPGKGTGDPETAYVILAADSEESGMVLKSSVRKIARIERAQWKCLVAGAGGGDFIDLAVQQIELLAAPPSSLSEARECIEGIVTEIHRKRIQKLPAEDRAAQSFELLCALWVEGEGVQLCRVGLGFSLILHAPVTIGSGEHLARYLIATYHYPLLPLYHMTRLAVYLLSEAKKHVMYCGGSSQVVWIDARGQLEELFPGTIAEHERSNAAVMEVAGRGILYLADPLGWGNDLSKVDAAVDSVAQTVKDSIKRHYPHLASQTQTARPLPPTPTLPSDGKDE